MKSIISSTGRLRDLLEGSLNQRIRWLFATFTVVTALLAAVSALLATQTPLWPQGVVVFSVLVAVAVWAWHMYRRGSPLPVLDLVPMIAIVLGSWGFGHPKYLLGVLFVALYGRCLYGDGRAAGRNAVGYVVAYDVSLALTHGPSEVAGVSPSMVGIGVLFSAGIMWLLGDVVRTHERAGRRQEVLARSASRLQHAADHDAIYDGAVHMALELVQDVQHATAAVWRGNADALHVGSIGGDVPEGLPIEAPLDAIPDDVREALLTGDPFELDEETSTLVQESIGMGPLFTSLLVAPITSGDTFSGALAVGSREPLPDGLVQSLGRLAGDVGLAFDRADSTVVLHQVVDNSSDAILLLDADLRIDFASPAIDEMLGYRPEELVGRVVDEFFSSDAARLRSVLETAASASELHDPEVRSMTHSDGSKRRIELAAVRLPTGRRDGWVVNLRDVTRRVKVEHALRESEERFRSLADSVSEGLYRMVLEPEPRFEYVNPAMEHMTGYPSARFFEDPELTLRQVHPEDREIVERTRTAPDTVSWPADVRWRHPEKGWRWLSFQETIVYDEDGTPLRSMGIVSDVTGRREQERALRGALETEREVTEQLRRVDEMRTTFLQAVSHELRTPLTAIVGYTKTLNGRLSDNDEAMASTMLERLEANADKLHRLLTDLLDIDRLTSGSVEPVRRNVDVAALCRRVVDHIENISHPVSCTQSARFADVDAAKVERVAENLVRNAMKHTEAGTPIIVDVVTDEPGDGVVITVEDRGPGVPGHLAETLFDPFVQGPGAASAAKPGTGIGLALVRRFAELHGGSAWLEHPDESGARFCVWLPSGGENTQEERPETRDAILARATHEA